MTVKEFIQKIQTYCGLTYPEGQRKDLLEYLQFAGPRYLTSLYHAVIRLHSTKWKSLPDVAIFISKEVTSLAYYNVDNVDYEEPTKELLQEKEEAQLALTDEAGIDFEAEKFFAELRARFGEKAPLR